MGFDINLHCESNGAIMIWLTNFDDTFRFQISSPNQYLKKINDSLLSERLHQNNTVLDCPW